MVKELLSAFGKYFEDEQVVLDSYKLQNGIYYLFSEYGKLIDKLEVTKDTDESTEIYNYFKERDYYSNYIDSNKAVENKLKVTEDNISYSMNKKICSNNYLTLFFKNKFIKELNKNDKDSNKDDKAIPSHIFRMGIDEYFNALINLGTSNKKGEKEILESLKDKVTDSDKINSNKNNMIQIFDWVIEDLKLQTSIKNDIWIKIFTKANLEEYELASRKYIALKLFNRNDNNISINNETYGVNNYNFGLNSKKPFLELKSTPYKVGLISFNEIRKTRNLYTWLLKNITIKRYAIIPTDFEFNIELDKNFNINNKSVFLLRVINNNGSAKIEDFETLPNYNTSIRRFECKDYLNVFEQLDEIVISTQNIYEMESFVSKIWFSNYLTASYYTFKESVSDSKISEWKKRILKKYSEIFKELFLKQNSKIFITRLDEIALEVVVESLKEEVPEFKRNHFINARKSLNLWIALDRYFKNGEESFEMKNNNIIINAKEIVKNGNEIENDETFYYLAGQVTYYIVNNTKADKPTQDLLDPVIKANNIEALKSGIQSLYKKYNHELRLREGENSNKKFNTTLSKIMLYEPSLPIKDNQKFVLAGALGNNLFLEKNEDKKEIKENEEEVN